MRICGQEFSSDILNRIGKLLTKEPGISRAALSRHVCQWLNWRSSTGVLQEGGCRKALAELDRRGALTLPKVKVVYNFQRPRRTNPGVTFAPPKVNCSLSRLGAVEIVVVTSRYCKDWHLWNILMDQYHYLGRGSPCGGQIRYLVKSPHYGPLGALSFGSATWALRDREKHIGWSEPARIENLRQVVSNDRFLIVPTVRVKNLASHILSLTLRHLPEDWEARYQIRPVLAETFVDPTRFAGACYKASNWMCAGTTAGRRDGIPKKIFVRPLCKQWREILCAEPRIVLGGGRPPESPSSWAEKEFGAIRLYDGRLKRRLVSIAEDFFNRPQANIPEASGAKARTLGAYRFFQNTKVTMNGVLTPHTEATIERIKQHAIVLAPQDTSTLNYCAHPATEGLGPINTIENTSTGLMLHDTVAFTPEGVPLGVLDAQCWARDPKQQGKRHRRKHLPIEQKESMKWLRSFRKVAEIQHLCPETTLVSIGDREADLHELFFEAAKDPWGPKLLVRAEKSRKRRVEQENLWQFMTKQQVAGALTIHLPSRGNQKARDVIADIRFARVTLTPPKALASTPVQAWAVHLLERHRDGATPIEWMLLTTAPVKSLNDAKQRVEWYAARWGIEVYHRTLKSGCKINDRQLGTADRLATCLGVDMVVAWRIYHLTMLGRAKPDQPCTEFLEDIEWKALCCYYTKNPEPPQKPPLMWEAVMMIGIIGGHLGRKQDGMPGTQCLWRGIQRLDTAVDMYSVMRHEKLPQIRRCYPKALHYPTPTWPP